MTQILAALYDGKGAMQLAMIEKPTPGTKDALIQVRRVGVCGSDLLNYGENTTPESVPGGHEVAGEIVEVGGEVDSSIIGQRVAVESVGHGKACLSCWYCRTGQYRNCTDKGSYNSGGFAQYISRRVAGCYPLPDGISWEEGALVEPLAVSVHAIRRGKMSGGETVAVLGAGNIGLATVAAARALGAGTVFATARHQHQAAMAKRLGADEVFPPDGRAFQEFVADATGGRGADLTVETVGGYTNATIVQAIDATRVQGRIVVLGGFHTPITVDWMEPLLKEQSIIFSTCYSVLDGRHDFEIAIDLMASGKVQLQQIVTHKFSLEDIQKAFETAYDKTTGSIKVQIAM